MTLGYHLFTQSSAAPAAMAGDIARAHGARAGQASKREPTPASTTRSATARAHQRAGKGKAGTSTRPAGAARQPASGARPSQPSGKSATRPGASTPAARQTASPGTSPSHAPASSPSALSCSGSGGMLPENYATIVRFLMAHGYTGIAAAGIAGNIYQESKGNPEAVGTGGGGLIGWTPLPAGFVTGNPAADLRNQLNQLLVYNQQWARYIPALNAATSATQAADIYMSDFERPGIPAAANREGAAAAVAAACHL